MIRQIIQFFSSILILMIILSNIENIINLYMLVPNSIFIITYILCTIIFFGLIYFCNDSVRIEGYMNYNYLIEEKIVLFCWSFFITIIIFMTIHTTIFIFCIGLSFFI
jgi:hypothetical protein